MAPLFFIQRNQLISGTMQKFTVIISALLCTVSSLLASQNAPVTVTNSMINPTVGSVITIPVTVTGFSDIASFSLVLDYNPAVLTFLSDIPNPAFDNFLLNGTTIPGRIRVSWFSTSGLTLLDGDHLFDLRFQYHGGTTDLTWYTPDGNCEYAKFNGGSYTVLNDLPKSDFYINGRIENHPAPVTIAPVMMETPPGSVGVPILVTGFNDIGTISLTLRYDPNVLIFHGVFIANPLLVSTGAFLVASQDAPGGMKDLRISWIKSLPPPPLPPATLADSSTLVTLFFDYPDSLKTTDLVWIEDGSSCEYSDGALSVLGDSPASMFYMNGVITGKRSGPVTIAPSLTALPGSTVHIPVVVNNFSGISAFNLSLDYDPNALTFQNAGIPNLSPPWNLVTNTTIPGRLVLTANGTGTTLPDSSVLVDIAFTYHGGNSYLNWYDADGSSCLYTDASTLLPLYDKPQTNFYINGLISSAPVLGLKVFMEGPYNAGNGTMNTTLASQGILPLNQPYSDAPWNYSGTESVTAIPSGTTDWVLIELRKDSSANSVVTTRAAFITENGLITGLDGITPITFPGMTAGFYYLSVYHRNHLAVMTANPVAINAGGSVYDFSSGPSKYYKGASGTKLIDSNLNRWGMISGDANNDGNVYINDYTDFWVPNFGKVNGYYPSDFNLDGNIYINDNTDYWVPNFGFNNPLP
jgi:hypothetical protein